MTSSVQLAKRRDLYESNVKLEKPARIINIKHFLNTSYLVQMRIDELNTLYYNCSIVLCGFFKQIFFT